MLATVKKMCKFEQEFKQSYSMESKSFQSYEYFSRAGLQSNSVLTDIIH